MQRHHQLMLLGGLGFIALGAIMWTTIVKVPHTLSLQRKPSCKPDAWFAIESDPRLGQPFEPKRDAVRIFVFADGDSGGVCPLARSMGPEVTLNVLGFRKSQRHFDGTRANASHTSSYMKKLHWMRHLTQHTDEDDVILFLDAFDSIAQQALDLLLPRFTRLLGGCRGVLFQGERNCFPFDQVRSRGGGWAVMANDDICVDPAGPYIIKGTDPHSALAPSEGPYIIKGRDMCALMSNMSVTTTTSGRGAPAGGGGGVWLNSGGYMGDVLSLRAMLAGCRAMRQRYPNAAGGDQTYAQLALVAFPAINMHVDSESRIWFALQNYEAGQVPGIGATGCDANYTPDPSHSLFMHFNGNGKGFQASCTKVILRTKTTTPVSFMDYDRNTRIFCP
jgi:hypothetical protein